ncbi:heme-copper oxidase subunit III family protein [Glaciimonas sp. PCH181]|uniref:heme-copper oxidase subunit III family protein n=1 Tax=Glaciimonas sp. PCH181 TaxID=2133943 RepID=UPI000D3B7960|nr:heme-copper oxidase subunit III family protein [Glaciimonas sp. PCH181]PUA18506.1 bb3-type cytochrome oxidase subunit IV [Glaciimonas sp. PCH181]
MDISADSPKPANAGALLASEPVGGGAAAVPALSGVRQLVSDWSSDRTAFKVSWGKAMMWIFLLSDTFIFSCFLVGYMTVRMSGTQRWPDPSVMFALHIGGVEVPLLLIAIMTFVLISSSGTMAMAVNFAYRRQRVRAAVLMLITACFGVSFVSMQAFEWTNLIVNEHVRPWHNLAGAPQFGASFFMITGFHGLHVSIGVIYLVTVAVKVLRGRYERSGNYQIVEIAGLYWHFVDLVWVFIFALFYLW